MRSSTISTLQDTAGDYEVEAFDCPQPKAVIVCAHGKGVRRWDGEEFFYRVADHYPDCAVLLVDQNQPYQDGCQLNDLAIMVARVQGLIAKAKTDYPAAPIVVLAHSMGCGVVARLNDLAGVQSMVFVAPAAGDETAKQVDRYGVDILNGKVVTTGDGLIKNFTKAYMDSVKDVVWEEQYRQLLQRFKPVYAFESGEEEIVGEDRFAHRTMPFASYNVIPGAKHNVAGEPLKTLFAELDPLIAG